MRVVCDTGPIFHLIEASLLDLLPKAGEVHIPTIVDSELTDLLRHEVVFDVFEHNPPAMKRLRDDGGV